MTVRESYLEHFLGTEEAEKLLQWFLCESDIEWQTESFKIFGRIRKVPRLTAWFGDVGVTYRYTGTDHVARGWPEPVLRIRNRLARQTGNCFNFVIVNRYRTGADYMGWHRDAEKGVQPEIASLSLGSTRLFRIRDELETRTYNLGMGSMLFFDGYLRHQLPKRAGQGGERVNLTFRTIAQTVTM